MHNTSSGSFVGSFNQNNTIWLKGTFAFCAHSFYLLFVTTEIRNCFFFSLSSSSEALESFLPRALTCGPLGCPLPRSLRPRFQLEADGLWLPCANDTFWPPEPTPPTPPPPQNRTNYSVCIQLKRTRSDVSDFSSEEKKLRTCAGTTKRLGLPSRETTFVRRLLGRLQ